MLIIVKKLIVKMMNSLKKMFFLKVIQMKIRITNRVQLRIDHKIRKMKILRIKKVMTFKQFKCYMILKIKEKYTRILIVKKMNIPNQNNYQMKRKINKGFIMK